MRITKQILTRRWAVSTILAALVFAVLAWSDLRLKNLSGFGTADLQGFATADQYRHAFMAWPGRYAVRAGFNNITNHRNPYAVNTNVDSPEFLTFSAFQGRGFTSRLRLLGRK